MEKVVTTSDGVDLAVTITGPQDAPVAAILVHGWCLSSEIYQLQQQALAAHPIRVVAYDTRGHGRSGKAPRGSTTIARIATDLSTVIDDVCGDVPVILVGHSMGGMTIMALAEAEPERFVSPREAGPGRCTGVVFVNTAAGDLARSPFGLPRPLAGVAEWFLPREFARRHRAQLRRGDGPVRRRWIDALIARSILFGDDPAPEHVRLGRRLISTAHPGVQEGFFPELGLHQRHQALKHLTETPVRVLAGTRDRLTPLVHSRRIADALPDARLSVFPGAGHMIPLERADELTDTVVQLARLVTDGTRR